MVFHCEMVYSGGHEQCRPVWLASPSHSLRRECFHCQVSTLKSAPDLKKVRILLPISMQVKWNGNDATFDLSSGA